MEPSDAAVEACSAKRRERLLEDEGDNGRAYEDETSRQSLTAAYTVDFKRYEDLVEALEELFMLVTTCGNPRMFANGVTDSTGTIDEGEVLSARTVEKVARILAPARREGGAS